jgi:FtsP/CotA-like multicopper oxidase with cupredoxin domain
MISRRDLLKLSGLVGVAPAFPVFAKDLAAPDYKINIAPVTLDLSPRHKLKTIAYNGQVPGPLLRLRENQPVMIEVTRQIIRSTRRSNSPGSQ